MTARSPFLFSVRETPLAHIFQSSTERFFSAAEFADSFVVLPAKSRDQTPRASSKNSGNIDTDAFTGIPSIDTARKGPNQSRSSQFR